jgi:hypothetical protein
MAARDLFDAALDAEFHRARSLSRRLRDAGYRSDGTPLTDDDVVDLRDRCPECGQVLP